MQIGYVCCTASNATMRPVLRACTVMMRRAVPFNYVQRGLIIFWCGGLPRVLWVPSLLSFLLGLAVAINCVLCGACQCLALRLLVSEVMGTVIVPLIANTMVYVLL